MSNFESILDRLLRAAAPAPNDESAAMPFGFDTRVLAYWRESARSEAIGLVRLLRRVILVSLAVITIASAGAYRELSDLSDLGEPFTNEYALADNAIGDALEQ